MKLVIVLLTLVNFGLLVPGVSRPIYSVEITSEVDAGMVGQFEGTVYQKTRSILGAVRELFETGDYLVSFLILFFSVIVPVTKGSMLLGAIFAARGMVRTRLLKLVDLIGKWSMADVFVVGVFLAYLATQDQSQANVFEFAFLGNPMEINMMTHVTSTLGVGFYFFLGYCLFSIFWNQMLKHRVLIDPV